MRYALIDNSTLTGVQRLLGEIPIQNKLVIDMDILCLESLMEAVLFYDKILVIDDYKPIFKQSRQNAFPYITALGEDVLPVGELVSITKDLTESIVPRVEGGQFTDQDFKPFFDLLKMNVTFTWDMSSSVYFLTQKMLASVGGLDLEKYSQLSSAIYSELLDKSRALKTNIEETRVVLVDSQGTLIGSDYEVSDKQGRSSSPEISKQAWAFFAGLNWLAFRTIFYTLAARALGADLFLHPIRQSFQANFIHRFLRGETNTFKPLIDAMNNSANDSVNKILGTLQPFVTKQPTPLFVNWFAAKIDDPRRFIEFAHQLRSEAPFIEARRRFIDLESSLAQGDFTTDANLLIEEVNQAMQKVVSKYGVAANQGVSSSSIITLWNLSTLFSALPKIPNVDVRIPQLEFLKHVVPTKGFKALYRSLVSDLVQVGRLGAHHDIITSKVFLDKDASEFLAKEEKAEFRRQKSYWKLPM